MSSKIKCGELQGDGEQIEDFYILFYFTQIAQISSAEIS